jgi:hypothetical protein
VLFLTARGANEEPVLIATRGPEVDVWQEQTKKRQ